MRFEGEIIAVVVSVLWTVSAVFFESASKRVGSLALNFVRMTITILFTGVIAVFTHGAFLPFDAGATQWIWLSLSGFIGLFVGDYCLFRSYVNIGARSSQLIMTLSPVITALLGFLFFDERLLWNQLLAMVLVVLGIALALLGKGEDSEGKRKYKLTVTGGTLALALMAPVCQAVGYIFTKKGMQGYDMFSATQIRSISALVFFALVITAGKWWRFLRSVYANAPVMKSITIGSVIGPVLGISLSLYAISIANAGVAATLMSLTPVFLIIPAALSHKNKVTLLQVVGSVIAVASGALFFI